MNRDLLGISAHFPKKEKEYGKLLQQRGHDPSWNAAAIIVKDKEDKKPRAALYFGLDDDLFDYQSKRDATRTYDLGGSRVNAIPRGYDDFGFRARDANYSRANAAPKYYDDLGYRARNPTKPLFELQMNTPRKIATRFSLVYGYESPITEPHYVTNPQDVKVTNKANVVYGRGNGSNIGKLVGNAAPNLRNNLHNVFTSTNEVTKNTMKADHGRRMNKPNYGDGAQPIFRDENPAVAKNNIKSTGANVNKQYDISENLPGNIKIKTEPKSPVRAKSISTTLYAQLMALGDRSGYITNADDFDCIICMTTTEIGDGVILRGCLHQFCYYCMKNAIVLSDEAEIPCPHGDGTTKCDGMILDSEIRAILSAAEYENYLKRSLRIAEGTIQNTFHCKKVDCDGWCICEDGVNEFACPKCQSLNCLVCQAIHKGRNCKQYQEEIKYGTADQRTAKYLEGVIKKNEAMKCPKCQIIIMKRIGCDWLQCSMCRTEICWATKQARWGPKGKGDISGGCRCGINGIKCHPNCGFCH